MGNKYFFLFLCVLLPFVGYAQKKSNRLDSLLSVLAKHKKEDTTKVFIQNKLAEAYQKARAFDKMLATAQASEKLARDIRFEKGLGEAEMWIGLALKDMKKADEAIDIFQKSVQTNKKADNKIAVARCILNIGVVYQYLKQQDSLAFVYYEKSIQASREANAYSILGNTYNYLGILHASKGNYPKTIDCYIKAIREFERAKDVTLVSMMNNNLGNFYRNQKDYPNALKYLEIALQVRQNSKDSANIAQSYSNIANVYKAQKKYEDALSYYGKAMDLGKKLKDDFVVGMVSNNRSEIYLSQEQLDLALEGFNQSLEIFEKLKRNDAIAEILKNLTLTYTAKKDFAKAIELGTKGLAIAQKNKLKPFQQMLYESLAKASAGQQNYALAYQYHQLYTAMKDTLFNDEKAKSIAQMQTLYETEKKENQIKLLTKETALHKAQSEANRLRWYVGIAVAFALALVAIFLYRSNQNKLKVNHILTLKNAEINQQKEEIEVIAENLKEANDAITEKNQALQNQTKIIEKKNEDITASIRYAQRIQSAALPFDERISKLLSEYFILYKPRDIVSGDFYFVEEIDNQLIVIVADCTGHGVPGAFMSMMGMEILHEITGKRAITAPDLILNELHKSIRQALKQAEPNQQNRDGMDLSVLTLTRNDSGGWANIAFAGAKNPMVYVQNEEVTLLKADKMPIGGEQREVERIFTAQNLPADMAGKWIYLFTDGYQDQFGGVDDKKFSIKRLKETFLQISTLPATEQKSILATTIENHIAEAHTHQIDDITIMGIKL